VKTKKLAILITFVGLSSAALASVAFAHGHGHMRGQLFEKIDANKDGKVTLAEAKAAEKTRFAAIDADKDGRLTTQELEAHRASMHGDKPANPERAHKHKGRGAKIFAKVDANGDGAIDATESAAKAEKMFARMDDNGDGVVTKDEIGRGDCGHGRGEKPEHEGAAGSGPTDD
jgi:hypothetical protein